MQQNVSNTKAELLIPLEIDGWADYSVKKSGRFYKGYTSDLLSIDPTTRTVELSRDGLLQMLPEAMFFREEYFREDVTDADVMKQKIEQMKAQKEQLSVYFEAFDTWFAQHEMLFHQVLEEVECEKEVNMLRELYGIDVTKERDPLVRKLARLLLDGDAVKGNLRLLAFCVGAILDVGISYDVLPSVVGNCKSSRYTIVRYYLFIEGLSSEGYRQRMERYEEFFYRLEQWFLPYDCEVDYCIKDMHQRFVLGESLTLDYNTRFEKV